MKFGPVLTYKDVDEAKRLIGKKVLYSDYQGAIESDGCSSGDTLLAVREDSIEPFLVETARYHADREDMAYQFIREILPDEPDKPRYEPYDLSDPKVRERLRGRWIIYTKGDDYTTEEVIIVGFGKQGKDYWKVIIGTGEISATELLENYAFDDGTPCGRRVE